MKGLVIVILVIVNSICVSSGQDVNVLRQQKITPLVREIYAPVCVGRPPCDAGFGLVRLENGELRHYDYGAQLTPEIMHHTDNLAQSYMVSTDQGVTWENRKVLAGHFGADSRSPLSGEYMRLQTKTDGVYVIKSKGGIDGVWTTRKVWDISVRSAGQSMTRPVVFIRGGKRAVVPWDAMGSFPPDFINGVGTLYSDDDGETWHYSNLVEVPLHKPNRRDKSVRWQDGASEPTVVELHDGRLWMIIRTAQDNHYQSFSPDGGETWSLPEPSPFFGTLTNPTIGRLHDGRLLFIWNNTTPLPEFLRNEFTEPFLSPGANDGTWEDIFTNRDALHAAISDDDGKTWFGFRELYLNPHRNDGNYAETGGMDRSIHQSQFVETESGRVVVSVGQHWLHRSLLVFKPDWLLETSRRNDFTKGLEDWSVQGYQKGIRGHCALDRFESSKLITHPDDANRRVLQVRNPGRNSALFPRDGATWNFPAGKSGFVETRILIDKDFGGARICLLDRWMNPTDPTVPLLSTFMFEIAADGTCIPGTKLSNGEWHSLKFAWESVCAGAICNLSVDNKPVGSVPVINNSLHGISYIHFATTSEKKGQGILIESVKAEITR